MRTCVWNCRVCVRGDRWRGWLLTHPSQCVCDFALLELRDGFHVFILREADCRSSATLSCGCRRFVNTLKGKRDEDAAVGAIKMRWVDEPSSQGAALCRVSVRGSACGRSEGLEEPGCNFDNMYHVNLKRHFVCLLLVLVSECALLGWRAQVVVWQYGTKGLEITCKLTSDLYVEG